MTLLDRIKRRLAREEAERERQWTAERQTREVRYRKMDGLLAELVAAENLDTEDGRDNAGHTLRHLIDEYGRDLVWFFKRVRAGKEP